MSAAVVRLPVAAPALIGLARQLVEAIPEDDVLTTRELARIVDQEVGRVRETMRFLEGRGLVRRHGGSATGTVWGRA